jgi:hypothetical protein
VRNEDEAMSEEPGKRVVSWNLYLKTLGKKAMLKASALGTLCLGMYGLIAGGVNGLMIVRGWFGLGDLFNDGSANGNGPAAYYGMALLFGTVGVGAIWATHVLLNRSNKIKSVQRLTVRNAHMYVAGESLVCASDTPPVQQQAELLRAALPGEETPAEELLRAATKNGRDA